MARQKPIELFMPPNMLRAKTGGGFGGVDMNAIRRAESAMESLKASFGGMAEEGLHVLAAANDAYAAKADPATHGALLRAAHDIKGQAATFGFPLMAQMAATLARLLDETGPGVTVPMNLVEAHVRAMQVIHRNAITGTNDKASLALIAELDTQVSRLLAK